MSPLALAPAIAEVLGCRPSQLVMLPVSGGCCNETAVVEYPDGRVLAKWSQAAMLRQFEAESAGLKALREARTGLGVPNVIAASDDERAAFLLLEYLPTVPRRTDFDARLGRGLAALHRCTDHRGYGFDIDTYCGTTVQTNTWRLDWAAFYAEQRLSPLLHRCAQRGMDTEILRMGDALIRGLPGRLGEPEPSALIHGDLWSGNLHTTADGGPALIDPAAAFAHREAELGMMMLFGGFTDTVFRAYEEVYPLQDGWRERIPIYMLYHVLNHYVLFGGAYARQANALLKRLL